MFSTFVTYIDFSSGLDVFQMPRQTQSPTVGCNSMVNLGTVEKIVQIFVLILNLMNLKPLFIFIVAALHFFILIGFGHAGVFLGLTVFFVFELFNNPELPNLSNLSDAELMPFIGLFTIVGYLGLGASMLTQIPNRKLLYISGIVFLWLSVLCLLVASFYGTIVIGSIVFCIPFLVLSLYPFFSKVARRMWNKASV
jgi:hypothetical protein